jgi:hypothetical protein
MTTPLLAPRPTTTPGQRKLVLDDRPTLALATVETARQLLPGHDEDDIKALWEEGHILYAWNIGLGEAIEARLLPDSIDYYKRTLGSRPDPRTEPQVTAALIRALRVESKPIVTIRSLRLLLNCSSTQLYNLLDAKLLKIQPGTTWQTGPNGSALITVESFKQFLITRRLP